MYGPNSARGSLQGKPQRKSGLSTLRTEFPDHTSSPRRFRSPKRPPHKPVSAIPHLSAQLRSRSPQRIRVPKKPAFADDSIIPPAPFSLRHFVHASLRIPEPPRSVRARASEDLIFAFQEKMCALLEIEVMADDGRSVTVFPSRLNCYIRERSVFPPPARPATRVPKRPMSSVELPFRSAKLAYKS
jgi:hypothetical protein